MLRWMDSGIFVFDIYCPPGYPRVHCLVAHITPQANSIKVRKSGGMSGWVDAWVS